MMYTAINKDSKHVMHLIEKDTIGAEIGVWLGNTSKQFLQKGIKKLYMIDAYSVEPYKNNSEMSYQEYLAKYQHVTGEFAEAGFMRYYDRVYHTVKEDFKLVEEAELCRTTSTNWFEEFLAAKGHGNPEMLDWIYVDGDHSFEGCYSDLENALKVVKPGGLIIGDDYYWPNSKWGKKGVTQAVDKIKDENNLTLIKHGQSQYSMTI
mgnify:FL=1